jgi:hypothetical protein
MVEKEAKKEAKIDIEAYEKFISNRIRQQEKDFDDLSKLLSESLNLSKKEALDYLNETKKKILNILGYDENDKVGFVTTYHFLPWEFDYYNLAYERISKSLNNLGLKDFSYPIWYMDAKKEKPHEFDFFGKKFKIDEILNRIENKKEIPKIVTSYDYYEYLKNRFLKLFEIEKFDEQNKEKIIKKVYSNDFENKIKDVITLLKSNQTINKNEFILGLSEKELQDSVREVLEKKFILLFDLFNFFENKIKPKEKFEKFKEVCEFLLKEEKMKPILEKLDVNEFNINQKKGLMLFLLTILTNGVHIGAEWPEKGYHTGKFNKLREILGLRPVVEFKEGIFAERFEFTEPRVDSFGLRLIFKESLPSLISFLSLKGKTPYPQSFLDKNLRDSIKTYDFYLKFKEYVRKDILNLKLSKDEIKEILIEYYNVFFKNVNEKIKNRIENLINEDLNLNEAIRKFNEGLESQYRILDFQIKKLLAIYLLKCEFQNKKSNFYKDFIEKTKNVKLIELENVEGFGGVSFPLKIPPISFTQMLELIWLKNQL